MVTSNSIPQKKTGARLDSHPEVSFVVPAWFCDQVRWVQSPRKSNTSVYNLPICVRIKGALIYQALCRSLEEVQGRHQVLRSRFAVRNEKLIQRVMPAQEFSLPVTNLPESADADLFTRVAVEEASQPFNLASEFAFRARLLRFAPDEHILVITTHHLVCDDWSTGILLRDLFALYQEHATGSRCAISDAQRFEYADFIQWHENYLGANGINAGLNFWKQRLSGRGDFHYLQPDHPRPKRCRYRGKVQRKLLPEPLTKALMVLSRQEKVSVFMVMLAGFQCVLHQHSGQNDVAVGSCAANRLLTEVEPLIGRFANDLVIRTDLSGNPSFRELLARVRKDALAAYSYQHLPFAIVLEQLEPIPAPRLFQVMFIMQDAPRDKLNCPDLALDWVPLDTGTAKYDLCLFLRFNKSLELSVEYDSDLFEPITISRLTEQYRTTLEEMVRNPQGTVSGSEMVKGTVSTDARHDSTRRIASAAEKDIVEATLVQMWEAGFSRRPIGIDDDFFELGGDSLLASRLFARIRQMFGINVPLVVLMKAPTIRQLAPVIRNYASSGSSGCVVTIQTGGSRPPLFCAHGQSGNLLMYRSLAQNLGADQPVYGLQPPGLDGKLAPLTQIEDMAAIYVDEIQVVQQHGPYFLAGYCMGGAIAFEMAQQLHARGEPVGLVALLDSYNVEKLRETPLGEAYFTFQKLWFGWRHFLCVGSEDKFTFLRRRISELGAAPSKVSEFNRRAALSYRPTRYPGRLLQVCPANQYAKYLRPELRWDKVAAGGVEVFSLPIYPGQMFEAPHVRELANKLRSAIDELTGT
jgi:thioesterase domain-containing protein/acyl carrier protein